MNLYLVDKGPKRVAVCNFYRVPSRVAALELVATKSDGGPAFELECSAARLMIVQGTCSQQRVMHMDIKM
jgi:hypothetical protein